MDDRKQRNSSIEFLKIIALFFIVLCHSLPLYKLSGTTELDGYINLRQSTSSIQSIILILFSHLGQVGNALFIVSSAFFLLENKTVKKEKIVQYVLDTLIVSLIYFGVFGIVKGELPLAFIANSLFPITLNFYWFITCYIILYAIHPWLNCIIEKLEKRQLFFTNFCFFILYCIISYALDGKYYYSQLVGFIVYYFFVAYTKKYMPNLTSNKAVNIKVLLSCIVGFIATILIANYIGLRFPAASGLVGKLESFINPFIVGLSISSFNLCKAKRRSNKTINVISSTSLLVFVISNNVIVCSFVKPLLFEYLYEKYSYNYIPIMCIIIAVITLIISVFVALVYKKTIQRIVVAFCPKVVNVISVMARRAFSFYNLLEEGTQKAHNTNGTVGLLPRINLSVLSKYRNELMGISAVWVVLCHAKQHCSFPTVISHFLGLGNVCVDIFLFLGGLGMYFSLSNEKYKGRGILAWYKTRFVRVVIPYLVAAIPFYIWFVWYNHYGIDRFFFHISGLSFWAEHEGMWYVDLLIPLYIITPFIAKLIDGSKYRIIPTILLILFCLITSIIPIGNYISLNAGTQAVIESIQTVLCRVSGYILGYYCGKYVKEKKTVSVIVPLVSIVAYFVFGKTPLFNGWLLAIFLMAVLCLFLHFISKMRIIGLCRWLGERSLELYLANCILVPLLFSFTWKFGNIDLSYGNYFYYFMVLALELPLAQLIYLLSKKAKTLFGRKDEKNSANV